MKSFSNKGISSLIVVALSLVLSSCTSDIVVKSDVGELTTVKDSSVTSYMFDKSSAQEYLERVVSEAVERKESDYCSFNAILLDPRRRDLECNTRPDYWKQVLASVPAMPDVTVVKYRFIDSNLNGEKSPSPYQYVACIPEGRNQDRLYWSEVVSTIDGDAAIPRKKVLSNVPKNEWGLPFKDRQKVELTVRSKVCEKYGNL